MANYNIDAIYNGSTSLPGTERIRIDGAGNVGIGSTTPAYKLDVNGTFRSTGDLWTNGNIVISRAGAYLYINGTNSDAEIVWQANGSNRWAAGMNVGDATENFNIYNYTTATTNFTILKANGNVGIGSTAPGYKLDVNGTFNVTGTSTLVGVSVTGTINSSATEAVRINNNNGYISFYNTAGSTRYGYLQGLASGAVVLAAESGAILQFIVNGSERVRIDTNGNLGIGTTSPNAPLTVYKASNPWIRLNGGGAFSYIQLDDGTSYGYLFKNTSSDTTNGALAGAMYTYTDSGKAFQHIHSGTPLFTILSGGNVGIGTTSPVQKLDVAGSARFTNIVYAAKGILSDSSGVNPVLEVYNTVATNAATAIIRQTTAGGNGNQDIGLIVDIQGAGDSDRIANFRYYDGSTYTSRMAILRSGNVGIGTTPGALLDLYKGVTGDVGPEIRLGNNGNASGNAAAITYDDTGANAGRYLRAQIKFVTEASPYYGQIQFLTGLTTLTQKAVIKGDGNVGIGTSSPAYKLDVNGVGRFIGNIALITDASSGDYSLIGHYYSGSIKAYSGYSGGLALYGGELGIPTRFQAGGQYVMSLLTNGNVGIGATNPLTKLHVAGAIGLYQTAGSAYLYYDHSGVNTWRTGIFTDNTSSYIIGHDTGGVFATKLFAITMGGNVGVGTTSPGNNLVVYNGSGWAGTDLNGSSGGELRFLQSGTLKANIYASTSAAFVINSADATIFQNGASEKMRLYNGNLGIGTSTINYRLEVYNSGAENVAKFRGANDSTIIIGGSDTGGSGEQYITYQNITTATNAWMVGMDDGEDFRFAYGAAGEISDGNTLVKIGQDGNLGIGTVSAGYKLQVAGDSYITNTLKNGLVETRSFSTSFTNGVANRAADIRFPNSYINGLIEIEVTAGYNNQNSVGVVKKIFSVGVNPNNIIWNSSVARVVEAHGATVNNWTIGDFAWDAINSKYIIPIYHIVSTGNLLNINIRYFSEGAVSSPILPTTTLSAEYTTAIPAAYQTRHYVYYNDNVGIGTTSPAYKLDINGITRFQNIIRLKNDAWNLTDEGQVRFYFDTSGRTYFGSGNGYEWRSVADSALMVLTNAGSVGIAETSPIQKLHVKGNTVFGNFGLNSYKYNLYLTFDAAADESWARLYILQDYASTNNGGTIKIKVLWMAEHASFGAYEQYEISYKTYYPSPYTTFSKVFCTNKTTDFTTGGTYYAPSSTPNVTFYDIGNGYLYIRVKGYSATYNKNRFIEAEVFGRAAAVPVLETTAAPVSPVELAKTIQFLPQEGNVYLSGSLGIGTTNPSNKTTIEADATGVSFADNGVGQLVIRGTTNTAKRLGLGIDTTNNIGVIQAQLYGTGQYPLALNPAGGNVGIGSTTPNDKLDVVGRVYAYRYIAVSSNASLPAYATDTSTGMYNAATNQIGFSISGTEKLRIDSNGNVGIGTTSPTTKFSIIGTISSVSINAQRQYTYSAIGSTNDDIWFRSSTSFANNGAAASLNLARLTYQSAGTGNDLTDKVGIWLRGFYDNSGGGLPIYLGGYAYSSQIPAVTITALNSDGGGGNVGIGTTSPTQKLHVLTTGGSTTAPNIVTTFQANTATTILAGGGTAIKFVGVSSGGNLQDYDQGMISTLGYADNNRHGMQFWVKPNASTVLTVGQTIDSNGNVGIGTASPSGKLEVRTNAASTYVFTGTASSGYTTTFTMDDTASYFGHDSAVRSVIFRTNSSNRLTIKGGGNVGIGNGDVTNILTIYDGSTPAIDFNSGNNTGRGRISATSSDFTIAALTSSPLIFKIDTSEKVRIAANGNVGIGTSSPSQILDVVGTVKATSYIGDFTGRLVRTSTTQTITGNSVLTIDVAAAYIHVITVAASGGVFGISSVTYNNRKAGPEVDEIILIFKWPASGSGSYNISNTIGDAIDFNYGKATAIRLTSYKGTGGLWICEKIASNMDYTNL